MKRNEKLTLHLKGLFEGWQLGLEKETKRHIKTEIKPPVIVGEKMEYCFHLK